MEKGGSWEEEPVSRSKEEELGMDSRALEEEENWRNTTEEPEPAFFAEGVV